MSVPCVGFFGGNACLPKGHDATRDWSAPKDLAEAARWYGLAAEKGNAESQYDLGFMLPLGEGRPKNIEEGVMWLERAGELGEYTAFRLLSLLG